MNEHEKETKKGSEKPVATATKPAPAASGITLRGYSITPPVFCRDTENGVMRITVGGTPMRLQGFNYPPQIWFKNNNENIDGSISVSPEVYLGTVQAEQVIPQDLGGGMYAWIKQSIIECVSGSTRPGQLIVWYRYENFHDVHWLIDEILVTIPDCDNTAIPVCT